MMFFSVRCAHAWLSAALVVGVLAACSSEARAPRPPGGGGAAGPSGGSSGSGFNPGSGGDCADSVCGSEVHEVQYDAPNVYFVIDRSGSMAAPAMGGDNRYQVVREAAVGLVGSLGALINVGAALFPYGDLGTDACAAGSEVFAVTAGVPTPSGKDSKVMKKLRAALDEVPVGGTPISATLAAVRPQLAALPGRTIVMLLTDGGPNCNAGASCTVAECLPNIEGTCPDNDNCCEPGYPGGGPVLCLDGEATLAAVQGLKDDGIDVYVIGIVGSELYGGLLDDMAEVAGTAQSTGPTKYHQVTDIDKLEEVLAAIAAEAIDCDFVLDQPPSNKALTNVYLDCDPLPLDGVNGWSWLGDDTVGLHGSACERLKQGQVSSVQVVTGCPTETPN